MFFGSLPPTLFISEPGSKNPKSSHSLLLQDKMRCKSGLGQKRKSEHLALFSTLIFQEQKFECDPNK